jgi:1-hydroxycarotenoid 3,4-desaturase
LHMQRDHAVIIGGGIGGLCAAIDLAARGLGVTLLEKEARIGGKMREIEIGGQRLDAGPTVFTMRHVFDDLFAAAGARLEDEITLHPCETLARHAWSETERLDLFADPARSEAAIGEFAGKREALRYRAFLQRVKGIHDSLDHTFLRASRPNPLSMISRAGLAGLPGLFALKPLSTLWRELGRSFSDPRLRQLYARYATYCGSSPFEAAATLMIVAHVEQMGVYQVKGGMYRLAEALARLGERLGVVIQTNTLVTSIETKGGAVCGLRLADGTRLQANAVICNADANAVASGLFGIKAAGAVRPTPAGKRSLSAMVSTMTAKTQGFPLHHHTVFFSRDYRREFDDIFRDGTLPGEPTVYICAQDRGKLAHPERGLAAAERLLFIVNAPANGDRHDHSPEEIARCEARTMAQLQRCGLTVVPSESVMTTPAAFNRLFPATGGALYGRASHGPVASFLRPDARTALPGLYLAGGSVHPGPGVPMAALSGRLAARSLLSDLASTRKWRRGATFGGILTQ